MWRIFWCYCKDGHFEMVPCCEKCSCCKCWRETDNSREPAACHCMTAWYCRTELNKKKLTEKNFHCCQYFWQLEKVIEVRVQTNHVTIPANANPRLMTLTLIPQWEYGHHLSICMQQSAVSGQAVQHYSGNKCTDGFDRIYCRSRWCSW